MEKVVYILGAGFSAPLGLPVMSNFLEKSKDQYFKNPDRYKYFRKVFSSINKLSVAKNYYDTNLWNIEEILSILEMQSYLKRSNQLRLTFLDYLKDVIEYYTPSIPNPRPGLNPPQALFGEVDQQIYWGTFVAALLGYPSLDYRVDMAKPTDQLVQYSVISLNYDLVLENFAERIRSNRHNTQEFQRGKRSENKTPLAKIHGSINTKDMIPPTWNKGLSSKTMLTDWHLAYELLKTATQIRIIGYSLPSTDTYIKYLLRTAIVECFNLKRIDVICLDTDGTVQRRYDEFIQYPNYRFKSVDITQYLKVHSDTFNNRTRLIGQINYLEFAHEFCFL